jgi:hypothetical protein
MYHLLPATAVEPWVRRAICSRCWRRPPGSESLSPATPRWCQETCPLFQLLPALVQRAELMDPSISCPEHALREMIHQRRAAADVSDAKTLELYGGKVAHIIAEMVETAG